MTGSNDVIDRVIQATVELGSIDESWQRGLAIQGLVECGRDSAQVIAKRWAMQAAVLTDSQGNMGINDWLELREGHALGRIYPIAIASPVAYASLLLEERSAEIEQSARSQAEALLNGPRTDEGGFILLRGQPQLYIDSLFLYAPLLARQHELTGEAKYADEVVQQFEVHYKRLHHGPSGLFRHVWNERPDYYVQSSFWARGNAWFPFAYVQCLEHLGKSKFTFSEDAFREHVDAMLRRQDPSGLWRNTLDDPDGRLESSVASLMAYSIAKGIELGVLAERYLAAAKRALRAVTAVVDERGRVQRTASQPGGPGISLTANSIGQGLYLSAVAAMGKVTDVGQIVNWD